MQNNIFDHFRKQQHFRSELKNVDTLFFRISFDIYGAYLEVVDKKGSPVEVSYLNYNGAMRQVLRLSEQIKERNSFLIDWEKPNEQLYLSEYDYLIEQLRRCDNVVDWEMKPLRFVDGVGELQLSMLPAVKADGTTSEELLDSKVVLWHESTYYEDFLLLNEFFLLADQQLIEIEPLGSSFTSLPYFSTRLNLTEVPVFLSLFFSNVKNVKLQYGNYTVQFLEDYVVAQPSLIFEKIDVDDSLIMRVGQVLPNMGVEVLNQFELYRYAEINEMELAINVKMIEREPIESIVKHIHKLLRKHEPKKKGRGGSSVIVEEEMFIIPKETAANFIYRELPEILMTYQIFGAEQLKSYKISTAQPSLQMSLSHGIDFFEGEVSLDFGSEQMNLFDVLNQYNKNRYVLLSDGSHALVNEKYMRRLERLFKKKGKKAQVSFFDMPIVEEIIDEKVSREVFKKPRAFYSGLNELAKKKNKKSKVQAKLRPYQLQGVKWLHYLKEYQLGGCLADDMGLGKTLQTISLLADIYATKKKHKPTLVVMPKSLLYNWQREVEKFAPQLTTYIFYANDRDIEKVRVTNLTFTTYAIMRNEIEKLQEEEFKYVILDESQNIKNINALTTKAVMLLNAEHRLALSGTPIENNLGELYSLFRFLNPTMFGTLNQFNKDYLAPIQKDGDQNAAQHLRKKIYPFILRRLKKDVLKDLPDKIEQTLYVEMSEPQKRLYEQRRQFYQAAIESEIAKKGLKQSQFFIFQALNELRQIASVPENMSEGKIESPKRELLQEQLLDSIANGHKALIFANFLNAVELIGQGLDKAGIDFVSMTGATRNRQQLVDRFQNDPNCKAFVMTLKTGGTGLNLTAADTIFIYDPWWNVAAESQAIDRAHRMGQVNKVLAYKLIMQDTIEEKILKLQQAKKELFDNVISSDTSSVKALSEDDIDYILGG